MGGDGIGVTLDWKQALSILTNGAASSRLPVLVSGLAVVLLAYSAARMTWLFIPSPVDAQAPPAIVTQGAAAPRMDPLSLSRAIAQRHLLGSAQSADAPANNEPMPETRLNLQLRGVAASSDSAAATAIIADPAGKEDFYRVGDELPGGATLKEVHPQHIVISRGGRFETLRLPQQSLQLGGSPVAPGAMPAPQQPPTPMSVAPDAGMALRGFREDFMQDPQALANLLQGEPFRQSGRFVGYRVRPGRDGELFAKFGLQAGDVITAVNGISVVDPQGRLELMRNIGSAPQISVELLRNGAAQAISISLAQ